MSPCGFNKSSFISKHEYLVDQAKEQRKEWSEKDWEKSDAKMKQLLEECYEEFEEDLSSKETSRFWSRTAAYYVNRFGKGFLKELKKSESDLATTLEKGFGSIRDNPEEFLRTLLREAGGEDIKEALNDVGEELKELGKELEKWLNE